MVIFIKLFDIPGLLALTTVNSTTYSLISLVVGGAALLIAIGYLITLNPQSYGYSQYQSQYRSFSEGKLQEIILQASAENFCQKYFAANMYKFENILI